MRVVKVGNKIIGDNNPTYIIAEIGGNFLNFKDAASLIDLAVDAGVDAVKLQTFQAETIASKSAVYDMPNTGNANQFELFKKYEIDFEMHKDIWEYCHDKKVPVFSTPSHIRDIELLARLDCPVYKVGSDDAVNIPFLEEVADAGKPIILSTGMCTINEVRESVSAILSRGNADLILLHCVTNYPADPAHSNLKCIQAMKKEFGLPVGYSDHTTGTACCIGAAALGANIIEKHFTYDKNAEGPDHILSADPEEMKQIVEYVRTIESSMGDGVKRPSDGERTTRINNRKSIVSTRDIPQGTSITKDMIAIKRPGYGIQPKFIEQVAGRVARKNIKSEEPIYWDYVQEGSDV